LHIQIVVGVSRQIVNPAASKGCEVMEPAVPKLHIMPFKVFLQLQAEILNKL
jgi:hypothetical protein